MRYLIDYENAHWCGGQLYVVVTASSPEAAECIAADWMEEQQRELFADEYEEDGSDGDFSDECSYTVNSVELFDVNHEHWKYYIDESQNSFYPEL